MERGISGIGIRLLLKFYNAELTFQSIKNYFPIVSYNTQPNNVTIEIDG